MRLIQYLTLIMLCCVIHLCTSGCVTTITTAYSAKGAKVVTEEKRPDYVFWKGAGKVAVSAAEIALAEKAKEVDPKSGK